ncbi:MAG: ABC transporter ATP-binding protein [Burkholderiaceae bacterium]|nr:MAG: ABC transporter ATP-binding protein [Burkholderiaceae bacterium]
MSNAAIKVDGVSHAFSTRSGGTWQALQSVSLVIHEGEFLAIVGPSGCGKTTLLNLIAGLEPIQSGSIYVNNHPPRLDDPDLGYLFARDALLPWRTIEGNAELAMELRGIPALERHNRANELLHEVGLANNVDAYPAQLSQGMRQRAAIARTLATDPSVLMLDEPFSALDAQTKLTLQASFSKLWAHLQATVLLITHDLSEAIALADRVVVFTSSPGRVKDTFDVPIPRPRELKSLQARSDYHELYEKIWLSLSAEVKWA